MIKEQHIEFCLTEQEFKDTFSLFIGDAKSLLIVHGHKSYQSCGAMRLINELTMNINVVDFDDFTENPKMADVEKGVSLLRQTAPNVIVAIGGGSTLDMAKLIRHYSHYNLQLIAIPTTAGTGAESTQFAVCYLDGIKHSISDKAIIPDKVLLYPPFTYKNNRYLTSCTGFDALAQAIEAYWNINSTLESDSYALRAIRLIYPMLIKDILSPSDRAYLMKGANEAGKAINITRTTVPHALSYTLTSKYGYPHGHAVALTFPFFLKYYLDGKETEYMGSDYRQYVTKMNRLREELGLGKDPFLAMKDYIKRLGLQYDPLRAFDEIVVACGINLERAKNSPMKIDEGVIMAAIQSIRK